MQKPKGSLLLPLVAAAWLAGNGAAQSTFLVTNTDDTGPGSLRQAIADANSSPGPDLVHFAIPGPGPHTIKPLLELTTVTETVVIDGYTQPGSSPNTNPAESGLGLNAVLLVEIDGTDLGPGEQNGLRISADDVLVRGLAIHDFQVGFQMSEGFSGIVLEGSFLGTDLTGTVARPNSSGVLVSGTDCLVGGTAPAARNLVSGNLGQGVVLNGDRARLQGSLVGTDVTGTVALANGGSGVEVAALGLPVDVLVGGEVPGARNLISRNAGDGVRVGLALGTRILGNLIGTSVGGDQCVRNQLDGIEVAFGTGTVIGSENGTNVIGCHLAAGTEITPDAVDTVVQGNHIGVSGLLFLGNTTGVLARSSARIGGLLPGLGNVISANNWGIQIFETSGVRVLGNLFGRGTDGLGHRPNAFGIDIRLADDNLVFRNRILDTLFSGVRLRAAPDVTNQRNRISQNALFGSGRAPIDLGAESDGPDGVTPNDPGDLDEGPNGLQNFPVLYVAYETLGSTVIGGTLSSRPTSQYVIELFTSPFCGPTGHGGGETFLGSRSVTTDAWGQASFLFVTSLPVGQVVTATATDDLGNTSEFSQCRSVVPLRIR